MHNYEKSNIKHSNREANHLKYEPEKEFVHYAILDSCQSILPTQK